MTQAAVWLALMLAGLEAKAIVGYVNSPVSAGYNYLANPLIATNQTVGYLLNGAPEGTRVYVWDITNQVFSPPAVYELGQWSHNYDLGLGIGFVLWVPQAWMITYVGEISIGTNLTFLMGSNRWSFVGSKVPRSDTLAAITFPGTDGDSALLWNRELQSFATPATFLNGHGWFDPSAASGTNGPVLEVARAMMVQRPGAAQYWTNIFSIFRPEGSSSATASARPESGITPEVTDIWIVSGSVSLTIESGGAPYDLQFSTDAVNWSTVARNQTARTWTGAASGPRGYYRAVAP